MVQKQELVQFFYGDSEDNDEIYGMLNKMNIKEEIKQNEAESFSDLLGNRYRYRFILCCWLSLGQQMCGINALIF